MKLKVCGMKLNTLEVAALQPDYLGFIFWEPSKRFFEGIIPELPATIKKVGVFVDATLDEILEKVNRYGLGAVQLHGKESPEFCSDLKKIIHDRSKATGIMDLEIIKVFSVKEDFDFNILAPYENVCDFFLFDTKGKLPGGNGYTFNWEVLKNYPSNKPYFLSGGIGVEEIEKIREFQQRPESTYCHAIDVNSKFESEPGLKDIKKLKEFKEVVSSE
ncbi:MULTISPECIES: phosphoribosylanthranilate isomerase [unclassified Arenibacter]|uniref:phosphoribosylanthranilate isomerase n=1 Tax=unclassified Arenibacter TaxID=2615047 RepID=UPI000E34CDD1|nr:MULTISPECIES: phosphoribosylanthranilate isomerase [unclassified Arenibacter]MCM4164111.1 N-(5'-phosphoribosyl)anthranilate isomerase [Arenibacter sp. A80]RFT55916.1 phosphoribosylanthranilate isomerase [Arenibacter sp. P308M17]